MWNDIPEQLRRAAELVMDNSRAAETEAMLMRLYVECDTGERRGKRHSIWRSNAFLANR